MTLPPVGQGQRRDSLLAKVPVPRKRDARCSRPDASVRTGRVTQPPHIAGPLCVIPHEPKPLIKLYLILQMCVPFTSFFELQYF